jgi:hypothetical protein
MSPSIRLSRLAAILLVLGLVLMAFDVMDLNLWHIRREDFPTAIIDIGLGAVGLLFACLTLWATVRGLGWVVSKFAIDERCPKGEKRMNINHIKKGVAPRRGFEPLFPA